MTNYLTHEEFMKCELEILLMFDKLAKENDISYSLSGGTLLGAVRHKGFIPWDDDVDIMLTRPEYNKLIDCAKKGLVKSPFKLSAFEIDEFPMPFMKLFDTRIKVEDALTRKGIPLHPWVDIFPIDSLPSDEEEASRAFNKSYMLQSLINASNVKFFSEGSSTFKRIARMAITPPIRLFHINKRAERKLIKLAQSFGPFETASYAGCFVWGYGLKERLPKSCFEGTVEMEFEGHSLSVMRGWENYLSSIYGDYMTLPPEGEREVHGVVAWRED